MNPLVFFPAHMLCIPLLYLTFLHACHLRSEPVGEESQESSYLANIGKNPVICEEENPATLQ